MPGPAAVRLAGACALAIPTLTPASGSCLQQHDLRIRLPCRKALNWCFMPDSYPPLQAPERLLFGPGPSMVAPRVYQALAQPVVGHLDPYFSSR